ncbi:MAG TPA: PilZ domain-containing protein [Terriglobales bacterium]|nr:PilZ domain-containing protein [Terriglobales bacterium]
MTDNPGPRVEVAFPVRIWGMGADGHAFFQDAEARSSNDHDAKLCDIHHPLKVGDVVGIQFGEKKARGKITWVIDSGQMQKLQAGLQVLEGQPCPWQEKLAQAHANPASMAAAADLPSSLQNKRRYERHRIAFPLEIKTNQDHSHMHTQATDIGGCGCYVETQLPFSVGTALSITFWLDSERIVTSAVVRTCDGGVGMGIEFTGLEASTQQRLQHKLEELESGTASGPGT